MRYLVPSLLVLILACFAVTGFADAGNTPIIPTENGIGLAGMTPV